jgi:broad specificity phosphatase PhoE
MSIYFLRHVKTYNNFNNILSGRTETNILPNQHVHFQEDPIHFDYIFSSTAKRCIDTLTLVPQKFLVDNVKYTDNLLERSIGVLEGLTRVEAEQHFSNFFVNGKIGVNCIIPNGESIDDVVLRVKPLIETILSIEKESNCLICSHNQTLKIMYALIKNVPITDEYWHSTNFRQGVIIKID